MDKNYIYKTVNLDFEKWHEILLDPVLLAAFSDRLTHKPHLINMEGESYRLRETMNLMQQEYFIENNHGLLAYLFYF